MKSFANKLGVHMHGVNLSLEADNSRLLAYAAEHLKPLVTTPAAAPELTVRSFWREGEWDPSVHPFATNGALNVIGKRMLGNAEELIWLDTLRMDGLQLRFVANHSPRWTFEVAYCFRPEKRKIEKSPDYEYKRFFSLMSYLVYYPITWYLEYYRDWTILHASALASKSAGVIVGGLGGVGKTTTCVALMQQAGLELISENLIFTDGEFIYPCEEPIRLDHASLVKLGGHLPQLSPMNFPDGLKKKSLFHLNSETTPQKVKPALFFLPQFTPQRELREIAAEAALEKMTAINRLTRELDDYYWYAAALEMHWPKAGQAQKRAAVLHKLVRAVSCFELGIDRHAGVKAVVQDILSKIK
jgi:hypothetical protein